ncbi:uncharacterized protein LOC120329299 isoform X1 [Styela clava]
MFKLPCMRCYLHSLKYHISGSSACKIPDVQNAIEAKIRDKALSIREMKKTTSLPEETLIGKQSTKRIVDILLKTSDYNFDVGDRSENDRIFNLESSKQKSFENGIGILICPDENRKAVIKSTSEKIFLSPPGEIRWPNIEMTYRHCSVSQCVVENFRHKIIGHTDFFLLYAVVPDFKNNKVAFENDVQETVNYFEQRHASVLDGISKLFIFECSRQRRDEMSPSTLNFSEDPHTAVLFTDRVSPGGYE